MTSSQPPAGVLWHDNTRFHVLLPFLVNIAPSYLVSNPSDVSSPFICVSFSRKPIEP